MDSVTFAIVKLISHIFIFKVTIMKNISLHYVSVWVVALVLSIMACSAANPPADKNMLRQLPLREIIGKYDLGNFYIGISNHAKLLGELSTKIADREFGYITPANDFKQSYVHPVFDRWRWEYPDAYIQHAKEQGQVLRLHGPISPQCSKWVKEDNRTPRELTRMLREYMMQLCVRYAQQPNVLWMDVVNETIAKENLNDPVFGLQKQGEWFAARQGTEKWENPWTLIGYDEQSEIRTPLYINMAFEISNQYAPRIKQIINQHGNFEEVVWNKMKQLVKYLRDKGRRVDGIGWQAHIDAGWEKESGNIERLDRFITWCHTNGLEFHITEMNVWNKTPEVNREKEQADTYAAVVRTLLPHTANGVVGLSFWNVRDEDTSNAAWLGALWRNDGTPRPAYERIKEEIINYVQP